MNQKIKIAFLGTAMCLSSLCSYAQNTLTGTIKDSNGEPLIGVAVSVDGKTQAITDIDGNYSLTNVSPSSKISVSYVGYKDQTIVAGNHSSLNFTLKPQDKTLDEVVVVGYGTMKRRDLTGAVASVKGDDLAKNPVSNVAEALQGQLPGVSVTSQDGRPGASMSIRVRGGGSIVGSNDPLYVVDGVQVSRIDDIPADDIVSIDVLKDAASTAIYGARGANGVILITTKKAKKGTPTIKYNMYYQYKEKPDELDVMDPYDYVLWTWSYATAYGQSYGDNVAKYFGLGSANGNHLEEYRNMKTHNYMDDINSASHAWNHDISLSGGGEHNTYYASVNYLYDKGSRLNTGFRRWNANFKFTQDISKTLKWDLDARYSEMRFRGAKFNLAGSAYTFRPVDTPLGEDDPSVFGNGSTFVEQSQNPVDIIRNYDQYNDMYRLRANTGLTWTPVKGLTARSELTLGRTWRQQKYWDGGHDEQGYNEADLTKAEGYNVRWATTVNYKIPGLGEKNSLDVLLGNEVLASKTNTSVMKGYGYPEEFSMEDAFAQFNMTGTTDASKGRDTFSNTIGEPNHTTSWFGRLNYSYLSRYLFTATFRADGSSKFAPDHHWGYFPAFAAAWRVSDEPFMAGTKDWLSNLKLRLSYGESGSDDISAAMWRETWKTSSINVDGETKTIYVPGDMKGNPDLKWETTVSRNLGIDFGFLDGRINGSLDFYYNNTKNLLMVVPVNEASGYSYQYQNVGKTENKGIELAFNYNIVRTKDFNLSLNATYNYNHNKVKELVDGVTADAQTWWGSSMRLPHYDYMIRVGKPVGTIQGYRALGYYTLDDFNYANGVYTLKEGVPDIKGIVNYPSNLYKNNRPAGQNAFPGMVKFADVTGDGVVDDNDATDIGHVVPQHTGGFNILGNWKSIDFSLGFTYAIGGKVYNANAMHDMMGNKDNMLGANRLDIVSKCWKSYNVDANGNLYQVTDPAELAALNTGAKYALPYSEYGLVSSQFVEDASYLRLQNLTLGYTFPKTWMQSIGLTNLRVYFTASNLFVITGYSGLDPDVNTNPNAGNGSSKIFPTPNYDYQAYPKTRSYTFGLNLTF